jgi:hypothetical protein
VGITGSNPGSVLAWLYRLLLHQASREQNTTRVGLGSVGLSTHALSFLLLPEGTHSPFPHSSEPGLLLRHPASVLKVRV